MWIGLDFFFLHYAMQFKKTWLGSVLIFWGLLKAGLGQIVNSSAS